MNNIVNLFAYCLIDLLPLFPNVQVCDATTDAIRSKRRVQKYIIYKKSRKDVIDLPYCTG